MSSISAPVFITQEGIDLKRCSACTLYKSIGSYSATRTWKGGVQSQCKPCRAETARRRKAHPWPRRTTRERFESFVAPEPNTGCWLWSGSMSVMGYGKLGVFADTGKRGPALAHRVAYQLFVGAIPVGLEIDHLCWVRSCVNPKHLRAVTKLENLAHRRRYRSGLEVAS